MNVVTLIFGEQANSTNVLKTQRKVSRVFVYLPPVFISPQTVKLDRGHESEQKPYKCTLDRIFPSESTQVEAFLQVGRPMVDAAIEGYNATIFCYGQSGAGKSFTISIQTTTKKKKKMFGPEPSDKERSLDKELYGIVPRCIEYLIENLNERMKVSSTSTTKKGDNDTDDGDEIVSPVKEWKVYVEFIQIYKNDLLDLLDAKSDKKLRIRQNFQTDTTQVENLSKISVTNVKDFDKALYKAIRNRITAKHALNAVSSRSHMLVMLSVEQMMVDASLRTSRLNFGDLAGSEDVTKALGDNPDPERLKEAIAINSSLSALTTAISMLSRGQRPSFRSSALTHILQGALLFHTTYVYT
ncbi:Kinesin motor domain containing protein [Reticulomyxa filosa]|uniref:Kinesin motor domain containing protein n=1 Tax=Reticulomyxa filosa TaxID=46433 RepID=X6NG17_RETFI|nr:Kinesin motor domain containing protein [Reticulomyxa filosa]|eukprot:ETO24886.1 Kinesin motor domain containing protein [Reticulomyxa filosa]